MFELDDRLRALAPATADIAGELRDHALAVDQDPYRMKPHLDVAAYELIRRFMTPVRFSGGSPRIGRFEYAPESCLQQVVWTTELAYGDAGMVMACPGPSLAGILVDLLGDEAQAERFYGALADGATWSFFAMTEPGHGSDASALETRLDRQAEGLYLLRGTKRYIGNGSRGSIGVVFARTGSGPLSIRAALVENPAPGFEATALDMIGLRGACLGEIRLDDVAVPAELVLGRHLPAARRGLWGAVRVFNTMRAHVAALAVGTGLALVDLVRAERPRAPGAADLTARLQAARRLVYAAGASVDRDRGDGQAAERREGHGRDPGPRGEPVGGAVAGLRCLRRASAAGQVGPRRVRLRVHGGHDATSSGCTSPGPIGKARIPNGFQLVLLRRQRRRANDQLRPAARQRPVRRRPRLRGGVDAGTALPRLRRAVPEPGGDRGRAGRDHRASRDPGRQRRAPLHDPVRIAEEWSVVDNLSGGRAGVSFASGWHAGGLRAQAGQLRGPQEDHGRHGRDGPAAVARRRGRARPTPTAGTARSGSSPGPSRRSCPSGSPRRARRRPSASRGGWARGY